MRLKWVCEDEQIVFSIVVGNNVAPFLPILKKGEKPHLENGQIAKLGPIFLLLEEGKAEPLLDGRVSIPFSDILVFNNKELKGLGLPEKMPYSLEVRGNVAITDPLFKFEFNLLNSDTSPVTFWKRDGAILSVGRKRYVISSPAYELIKSMEAFNQAVNNLDMDEKFVIWANLKEMLPEGSVKDDYLKRLEIKRADAFSLSPYLQKDGTVNFDPVLLFKTIPDQMVEKEEFTASLPNSVQNNFNEKFRTFKQVKSVYSMQNNVYCVLSKTLQKALKIVKSYQGKTGSERIAFARNPKIFLSDSLTNELTIEAIEEIFQETEDYSERVKEIGIWSPPIVPYKFSESSEWFIESEIVLKSGEKQVIVKIDDLIMLENEIDEKLENGIPKISVNGVDFPVPEIAKVVSSIKENLREKDLKFAPDLEVASNSENEDKKFGLNIYRNLENEEYQLQERLSREALDFDLKHLESRPLEHQKVGIRILQDHWISGSPGILMADDMGLGKTFQTLAFLSWVKQLMNDGRWKRKPFLLVAPTGLIQNWLDEAGQHLSDEWIGDVLTLTGNGLASLRIKDGLSRNAELLSGFHCLDINRMQESELIVSTYETIRDYQFSFAKIDWAVIVYDEMQKIKNPKARVTDAAKAMKSDFIVGLTGTPVENTLLELWCLIDTIRPGFLKSLKQFAQEYTSLKNGEEEKLRELNSMLTSSDTNTPIMLRRLKSDHLKGLPDKLERFYEKEMPNSQNAEYSVWQKNVSKDDEQSSRKKGLALEVLQKIRAISLHPGLVNENLFDNDNLSENSARVQQTFAILDEINRNCEKALIFCESRRIQGKLAETIKERYKLEHIPMIINGEISGAKRKQKVDIFQGRKGFDVMILSPKAGGVGLTLTAANHVIHLARWWNPAVEDQCTDRAYRIGQKKDVFVHYPLAIHPAIGKKSFDFVLNELLEKKRILNKNSLMPTQLTEEEKNGLIDSIS